VLKKPWTYLMVDFITNLPLVAEKDAILAEELAKLFRDNMWKLYRLPESVVLDREPQFNLGD